MVENCVNKLNCYKEKSMNMILELTNACNMMCEYCFEKTQDENRIIKKMPMEIIKKSIDLLVDNRENCHLTFFGGEPLLCKNLIKKAIEYGNQRARSEEVYLSYSIVTNGTLLDEEILKLLNENNVNIIYSFDGIKNIQDKYRPLKNGDNTYDITLKNLKKILSSRKDERYGHVIVRPTITKEALEKLNEIYDQLRENGCKEISFSLVSANKEEDYAITSSDLKKLEEEYSIMIEKYYDEIISGKSYNKFFESLLLKIYNDIISKEFCDCNKRYLAVSVDGYLYPCEGFLGVEKFKIGNILDTKDINVLECPKNVEENDNCKNCWCKYLCGGSCYHEAWMRTGSINDRDNIVCETYKIAIKYALKLYIKLEKNGKVDILEKLNKKLLPAKTKPFKTFIGAELEDYKVYVCDGNNHRIISLNETAFDIYKLCDRNNSIEDIAKIISDMYKFDKRDIYSEISEIIEFLYDEEIIKLFI